MLKRSFFKLESDKVRARRNIKSDKAKIVYIVFNWLVIQIYMPVGICKTMKSKSVCIGWIDLEARVKGIVVKNVNAGIWILGG